MGNKIKKKKFKAAKTRDQIQMESLFQIRGDMDSPGDGPDFWRNVIDDRARQIAGFTASRKTKSSWRYRFRQAFDRSRLGSLIGRLQKLFRLEKL